MTILPGLIVAACAFATPAWSGTCPPPTYTTWKGGAGNWSDSTKWTNGVPRNYITALIDGGNSVASPVTVNISGAYTQNLIVDSDDSLSFNNGTSLTVNLPTFAGCLGNLRNNGKITLNSIGTTTRLGISIHTLLYNSGTITLTDSTNPQNFITGSGTLVNYAMIQGAGNIGNGQPALINSGTILANASHGLAIQPGPVGSTNNGILQVASGSLMHVFGGPFTNFSGSTLTGGTYNVSGKLEIDQLGSTGGEIVTNAASIILNGSASSFVDAAGKDALSNFATNAAAGSFSLQGGRSFTTAGSFSNAGTLSIAAGSTFTVGGTGTTFTQTAGTTTDDGTLAVPSSGSLSLQGGSLFGKGTITGAVTSSGTVTPGESSTATGILRDTGKYAQNSAGTLDISIDGTTAGTQYDQLSPTTASLNGALNINRPTGYVPAIGATFKIMNFISESGKFTTVNGLAINSSEHFTLTYQATDVVLTVVSGPCCAPQSASAQFKASLFGSRVGPTYGRIASSRFGLGGVGETPLVLVPAEPERLQEARLQIGRNFPHLSPRTTAIPPVFRPVGADRSPGPEQALKVGATLRSMHNFSAGVAPPTFLGAGANDAIRNRINPLGTLLGNNRHAERMMAPKGLAYHFDLLSMLGTSRRHLWRGLIGQAGSPNASFGYLTFQ